ncbi:MAG: hypothetical protein LLG04_07475, partial [Parachlamydia sp.]|nr:hypothetical protein [Parachlamydia sp.]
MERITGKGESQAIKIPPDERKALLAGLAAKTKEKVQKEMYQSAAFYGMTIGEQVAKHAHVETEALGSGGEASFADEIERRALEKMKGDPSLTGPERERFEAYCRAADRSREFNDALEAVFAFMEATPPESMSAADIQKLAVHLTALTDEFYS